MRTSDGQSPARNARTYYSPPCEGAILFGTEFAPYSVSPSGAVRMADRRPKRDGEAEPPPIPLEGQRLVQPVLKAITRLHGAGAERDHAGNRKLFYDQYVTLLLMYFCNPALESLRALQQASGWEKTRQKLGIERASLGSLSEAARVFDAELLRPIVRELAAEALPLSAGRAPEALQGLT